MYEGSARSGAFGNWIASFGSDFRAHRPALLRFLTSRTGCKSTAEDIAQEAYIRFLDAAADVRSPKAYLFEVAGNLATDHRRVQGRRAEIMQEARDILWVEVDEITPERETIGREEMARVAAAVDELTPIAPEVFHLIHYEGLARQETADRLGVSRTTVQKHDRRVMDRIARAAASADQG